ncbi:MAG: type II secretion system F family protein [Myxococcota bacterium]|nr:type II secretion system F family protein [Myxococcota bacterium]
MPQLDPNVLVVLALALSGVGLFGVSFTLARIPAIVSPSYGPRGMQRQRARASGGFGAIEPLLRVIASWVGRVPSDTWRARLDQTLMRSGHWLGLTADEIVAMSALYALVFGTIGALLALRFGWGAWVAIVMAAVGAVHPFSQLNDQTARRCKEIERRLPDAVDLLTLCMGAGLDFPAALRRVLGDALVPGTPAADELGRIFDELELGTTRSNALLGFADRVPTRPVRDFVGAVVQAEEKGTPLVEILRVQARVLRMRRSVLAEEAAARAALQLMIPLLLIFGAIMLLVLGPVVITLTEL